MSSAGSSVRHILVRDQRLPGHDRSCQVCRNVAVCEAHDRVFPEFAHFKSVLRMSDLFIDSALAKYAGDQSRDSNLLQLHLDALQHSADLVAGFDRWEVNILLLYVTTLLLKEMDCSYSRRHYGYVAS